MKNLQKILCLVLALSMLAAAFSGCLPQNDKSGSLTLGTTSSVNPTIGSSSGGDGDEAFYYSEGIDENGFLKDIKAIDYVASINYQALPIPKDVHQPSEAVVQAEIDNIMSYYSSGVPVTDRAVENGDTVNIDYVGSVGGVEFSGGSTGGMGTEVTIGVTSYIDDFLEQLIGHMPGETINVEVTFPDGYHEPTLSGKDAVFITTINHILEEGGSVELTDEFVFSNFAADYGLTTASELKGYISNELQKKAVEDYITNYLSNAVTEGSIPAELVNYQEKAMLQYYREEAGTYGMSLDDFIINNIGLPGADELIEVNRETNMQYAAYTLASLAVAEEANLSVNEEDLTAYFTDYSQHADYYGLPYLKQIVLIQKVMDYITTNAVFE